jgi:hypothetical protein
MDEIQMDIKKRLGAELVAVYPSTMIRDDILPAVRAHYETGILPSLFGCEIKHLENDTLPAVLPLHDADRIRVQVDAGSDQHELLTEYWSTV